MQQILISIQSFDFKYIKQAINNIQQIINYFQLKKNSIVLPRKTKKYTLERSPHIDKKSREQFEIKKYKSLIKIKSRNSLIMHIIFYILKNSIQPGVEITFSFSFNHYYK